MDGFGVCVEVTPNLGSLTQLDDHRISPYLTYAGNKQSTQDELRKRVVCAQADGHHERAAALAVFHCDLRLAV